MTEIVIIPVYHHQHGDDIHSLSSPHDEWAHYMTDHWNKLVNSEDYPVKRNKGGQFPMCNIYDGGFSLDCYIGLRELCGEELLGNMTFGDMKELNVVDGLIWGECEIKKLLSIFNSVEFGRIICYKLVLVEH